MMRYAIVPCYNEERTIGSVVLSTLPHVDTVLVVDDGSIDKTADIAERAGADVLQLEGNHGKGHALNRGFSEAKNAGADIVITLDGDGQHNPESIPKMIEPITQDEADLVVGSRVESGDGNPTWSRRFGRRVLDFATNLQTKSDINDTQSGFRAFSSDALNLIPDFASGMGVESEILMHADNANLRIVEVDIEEHYNKEADPTTHPVQHAAGVGRTILGAIRMQRPLLFFGSLSILLLLAGTILGLDTAIHYYTTREFWPGKALLCILCTVVGVQFGTAGLMFDYFNRYFESLNTQN